jgi:hypothetical protein
MLAIFASTTEQVHVGWLAVIGVVSSALSAFGVWLMQAWTKRHEMRQKDREQQQREFREDEETAVARWQKISERLDSDRREQIDRCERLETRLGEIQTELTLEKVEKNRMLVWIRHLEERLEVAGVRFQKYKELGRNRGTKKTEVQSETATDEPNGEPP